MKKKLALLFILPLLLCSCDNPTAVTMKYIVDPQNHNIVHKIKQEGGNGNYDT